MLHKVLVDCRATAEKEAQLTVGLIFPHRVREQEQGLQLADALRGEIEF